MSEEECPADGVNDIEDEESAIERLARIPIEPRPDSDPNPTKTRVKELLRCPIDWTEIAPEECDVVEDLKYYWMEVATMCLNKPTGVLSGFVPEDPEAPTLTSTEKPELDHFKQMTDSDREDLRRDLKKYAEEVEGETFEIFFSDFFLNLETEEADLKDELPQIEAWIERSKLKYEERMRRFKKMRVATDKDYKKHFPVPNQKTETTRERSRSNRISYFYKGVTPEQLMRLWWEVLWYCWRDLLDVSEAKLYVDAATTIGASYGRDTSYLKLDVDLSTPQFHAYPIPKEDFKGSGSTIFATALVGTVRMD